MADTPEADPCHADGTAHRFDLVLERRFRAAPAKVFRAWTEPALLRQWFAPAPWTIADAQVDLRPGGIFAVTMRSPEGETFPSNGVVLEVVPDRRLVTTDAFAPGWRPAGQPFMVARIDFEPLEGGGTLYRAVAAHWTEEAMRQHEAMGFHEGWGTCADQLDALSRTL